MNNNLNQVKFFDMKLQKGFNYYLLDNCFRIFESNSFGFSGLVT